VKFSRNSSDGDLLQWICSNLPKIRGHAKKYLPFSPYDLDEFILQAHQTALEAHIKSVREGISFEHVFWSSFRIHCLKLTYTHGERIEVYHEEYREFGDEETTATLIPGHLLPGEKDILYSIDGCDSIGTVDSLSPEEQNILVQEALELMLPKEKQAWEYSFQGFSIRETAKLMGVTRQRIQNLMKSGFRRVRRHLGYNDSD